jgi:hypothetical protein
MRFMKVGMAIACLCAAMLTMTGVMRRRKKMMARKKRGFGARFR